MSEPQITEPDHPEVRQFWDVARFHAKLNAAPSYFGPTALESVPPPAWSFGDSTDEADEFVAQVLAQECGQTSAAVEDYDGVLPEAGTLSILCDGTGKPRALLEVSDVATTNDQVVESFRVVYAG